MLSGDEAASIPEYKKVTELRPAFFGAFHNLAVALCNTGREEESLQYYEAALRLDGGQAPVHSGYATALAKLGRYAEAEAAALAALRIDPSNARAREQALDYARELQKQQAATAALPAGPLTSFSTTK